MVSSSVNILNNFEVRLGDSRKVAATGIEICLCAGGGKKRRFFCIIHELSGFVYSLCKIICLTKCANAEILVVIS